MFLQTYGLLYERNSYIFTDMFQQLEQYHSNGGIELNDVMDSFFHRLYSKMFQVLNAQYTFDETYLKCVSEKMEELKPFGDIPKKLKIEVQRSFVATRTFVQSMNQAAELFDRISQISPSPECSSVISVFSSCPSCTNPQSQVMSSLSSSSSSSSSQFTPKFCPSVCPIVLAKCLTPFTELNEDWNKFVTSMLNLIGRLETSFNIESVVDPIDIKISEAIMNFQENGIEVSHKLFDQCGKPKIGKRDVRSQSQPFGTPYRSSPSRVDHSFPVDSTRYNRPGNSMATSPGASIERLLEDVKRKVKRSKDYWIRLPTLICGHRRFLSITRTSESQNCWNGSAIITDTSTAADAAVLNIHNYRISNRRSHPMTETVKHVISKMRMLSKKLNYAFNGLDFKWSDEEFVDTDSIVNGNGSGSGDGCDDDDDDDECEEDEHRNSGTSGGTDERIAGSNVSPDQRQPDGSSRNSPREPDIYAPQQPNNNNIYDGNLSPTPSLPDPLENAVRNKWPTTTKSPVVVLTYNNSSPSYVSSFNVCLTAGLIVVSFVFSSVTSWKELMIFSKNLFSSSSSISCHTNSKKTTSCPRNNNTLTSGLWFY